eukprot:PhM_4_TR17789/c0_g1_i1/m.103805/K12876/RBM8A, Y14; RNA-binding protein 8A
MGDIDMPIDLAGRVVVGRGGDSSTIERTSRGGPFDALPDHNQGDGLAAARSVEGYVIFLCNLQEEVGEVDVRDLCVEYGVIRNIHLNRDAKEQTTKGYAIVEYSRFEDAVRAVGGLNGKEYRDRCLMANFAFVQGPVDRGDVHHRSKDVLEENAENSERKRSAPAERLDDDREGGAAATD